MSFARTAFALLLGTLAAAPAYAGSATLDMVGTVALTNVDDNAGRFQYDGGDLLLNGVDVGHFLLERRVIFNATTTNQSAVTVTLILDGGDETVVLMGTHSFSSGAGKGGVAAASSGFSFLADGTFTYDTVADTLTLNW
jgi:hypothetical protein